MYDDQDDEMTGYVYKPCKNCGSTAYNNTEGEEIKELPDGRSSFKPNTCDKCNFELMLNRQKLNH